MNGKVAGFSFLDRAAVFAMTLLAASAIVSMTIFLVEGFFRIQEWLSP